MEVLSTECGQKKARKAELEERYDDILKKLQRAEVLMGSLASEQVATRKGWLDGELLGRRGGQRALK